MHSLCLFCLAIPNACWINHFSTTSICDALASFYTGRKLEALLYVQHMCSDAVLALFLVILSNFAYITRFLQKISSGETLLVAAIKIFQRASALCLVTQLLRLPCLRCPVCRSVQPPHWASKSSCSALCNTHFSTAQQEAALLFNGFVLPTLFYILWLLCTSLAFFFWGSRNKKTTVAPHANSL